MNEKQRDPRMNEILYPLYEEKRCTEIINDYELNEDRKKAGKLSPIPTCPQVWEIHIFLTSRWILFGWL